MKEHLVGEFDSQPAVRKNAETAIGWEFKEEAVYLYDMAVKLRERLIDPIARIDRKTMPDPIISFDNLRNQNTLAQYLLVRNPQGLQYEITFNEEHYIQGNRRDGKEGKVWRFGEWALLETLTHELIHEWQQTVGKDPVKLGKVYHNKEFVQKCESIGLHPKLGPGYHTRVADGAFEIYLKELNIPKPTEGDRVTTKTDWYKVLVWPEKKPGRSTLHKYECPNCHLKVRVGVKHDPHIMHVPCSIETGKVTLFVKVDGLHQTIFQSVPEEPKKQAEAQPEDQEVPYWDPDSERNQKELEDILGENYNPADDPEDLSNYFYY